MKDRAEIVVVGAGIAGASIALHLARFGRTDVLVLEQGQLVSGTTSHAPGLIGQLRASPVLTRLLIESVALYRRLDLDGVAGFQEVGSLRLASSRARLDELRRQEAAATRSGLEAQLLGPEESVRKFPAMNREGLEGALFIPSDGSATAPVLAGAMIRDCAIAGSRVSAADARHGHRTPRPVRQRRADHDRTRRDRNAGHRVGHLVAARCSASRGRRPLGADATSIRGDRAHRGAGRQARCRTCATRTTWSMPA